MADTIIIGSFSGLSLGISNSAGFYSIYVSDATASESPVQSEVGLPGNFSNMQININANTDGSAAIFWFRNSAIPGNGNETVSVTANTTGIFSDSTHSDAVVAGNLVSASQPAGNYGLNSYAITFSATSNTVMRYGPNDFDTYSSSSTTFYVPGIGGVPSPSTTETTSKTRIKKSFTVQNFNVNVGTNTSTNAIVYNSRINAGNGNLTLSVAGSATGQQQDTIHTDSVVAENDLDWSLITGASTVNFIPNAIIADFVSTNGDSMYIEAAGGGFAFLASTTNYYGLASTILGTVINTETVNQTLINDAYIFNNLLISVSANTVTSTSELNLRANVALVGNITTFIPASSTGIFLDSIHTYTSATTDKMNYQTVIGAGGTSVTVLQMSISANIGGTVTMNVGGGPYSANVVASFQTFIDSTAIQIMANNNVTIHVQKIRIFQDDGTDLLVPDYYTRIKLVEFTSSGISTPFTPIPLNANINPSGSVVMTGPFTPPAITTTYDIIARHAGTEYFWQARDDDDKIVVLPGGIFGIILNPSTNG